MTPEERWTIEGRVREQFRQSKKNLAALRIEIEEHAKKLEEASGTLRHFLAHPTGPGPTGMTSLQYVLHFFRDLNPRGIEQKLAEFEAESGHASELEKRVREFEQ